MTPPINILVIGKNPEILEIVIRLINNNPAWKGTGTLQDEEAVRLFHEKNFDLVLLGGGIEESSEQYLRQSFLQRNPDISIIQHFGGGSGLLSNEILEALEYKKKS